MESLFLTEMTVQEIIIKWDLNRAFLAKKIEMSRGTFNNKLSPKHTTKFTPQELIKLRDIIVEMGVDIDGMDAISFEDTFKEILK